MQSNHNTLATKRDGETTFDLVLFFLKGVEVQAAEGVERVQKIEKLMDESEAAIEQKMKVNSHKLTKCLFSKPLITIDYLQETLGLSSRQTASKYLSQLVSLGLVQEHKLGLHKIFYSKRFLKLLG